MLSPRASQTVGSSTPQVIDNQHLPRAVHIKSFAHTNSLFEKNQ